MFQSRMFILFFSVGFVSIESAHSAQRLVCAEKIYRHSDYGIRYVGSLPISSSIIPVLAQRWSVYEESTDLDLSWLDSVCLIVPIESSEASWNDIIDSTKE